MEIKMDSLEKTDLRIHRAPSRLSSLLSDLFRFSISLFYNRNRALWTMTFVVKVSVFFKSMCASPHSPVTCPSLSVFISFVNHPLVCCDVCHPKMEKNT